MNAITKLNTTLINPFEGTFDALLKAPLMGQL
jgi:hypothetical protein